MQISTKENIDGKKYSIIQKVGYSIYKTVEKSSPITTWASAAGRAACRNLVASLRYATLMVEERSLRVVEPTTYVGGG